MPMQHAFATSFHLPPPWPQDDPQRQPLPPADPDDQPPALPEGDPPPHVPPERFGRAGSVTQRHNPAQEVTMAQVREVMSREVLHIAPDTTIRHAAEMMRDHDIGALPICNGDHIVGMVTDRDLAMRGLAEGCTGEETVTQVATSGVG